MASKLLKFGEDARRGLETGVDKLADAVAITLAQGAERSSTRSGRAHDHERRGHRQGGRAEDPWENMVVQPRRRSPPGTNDVAGDGTTTATVLARAMVEGRGLKNGRGANPMALKRGRARGR
ncbi:MAG: hypothetical protein U0V56_01195 [Actinomycetota bacterium]